MPERPSDSDPVRATLREALSELQRAAGRWSTAYRQSLKQAERHGPANGTTLPPGSDFSTPPVVGINWPTGLERKSPQSPVVARIQEGSWFARAGEWITRIFGRRDGKDAGT